MREQSKRRTANLIKKPVHQDRTSLKGRLRPRILIMARTMSIKRPDTFSQATSRNRTFLLQSRGGPYIF